ncbi:CsgG/HfaB family protein [Alsobacter sp. KACC 23698]|uniref:CsgG/HfaB family protein n=1 Tax=Alsobacter sp. KACC 23698 TaxID=3149229 RepID=UPI003877C9FF
MYLDLGATLSRSRRGRYVRNLILVFLTATVLSACTSLAGREPFEQAPEVTPSSPTGINLATLPPAARRIDVAVYNFPDLTGQNKPNDVVAEYSRAVTQGGAAFVIDALRHAGGGGWFNVIERGGLTNLLQERQLIRATRTEFEGEAAKPLPPIRFAGLLIEGGIIAYDANTTTGGVGARYLGVGGDVKYRRDVVTVAMRVVSVQSGEVLTSTTVTKTIYSIALTGDTFKYIAINRILELEAGVTRNEPTQLAVREAIELAVYSTVMEGARIGLWRFKDRAAGQRLIEEYLVRDKSKTIDGPVESSPVAMISAKG